MVTTQSQRTLVASLESNLQTLQEELEKALRAELSRPIRFGLIGETKASQAEGAKLTATVQRLEAQIETTQDDLDEAQNLLDSLEAAENAGRRDGARKTAHAAVNISPKLRDEARAKARSAGAMIREGEKERVAAEAKIREGHEDQEDAKTVLDALRQ